MLRLNLSEVCNNCFRQCGDGMGRVVPEEVSHRRYRVTTMRQARHSGNYLKMVGPSRRFANFERPVPMFRVNDPAIAKAQDSRRMNLVAITPWMYRSRRRLNLNRPAVGRVYARLFSHVDGLGDYSTSLTLPALKVTFMSL
jgi:hypothetical protein